MCSAALYKCSDSSGIAKANLESFGELRLFVLAMELLVKQGVLVSWNSF